jgi:hypothetical protein
MPQEIQANSVWRGPDLAKTDRWVYRLTAADVAELDAAYRGAAARGNSPYTLTLADFPLPNFSKELKRTQDELENGLGVRLLRGFPAARYTKPEMKFIYWGIGLHLGTAVTQSRAGDVLGDVRDIGVEIDSPTGRGYTSSAELNCHCDSCDVTGLFCLQVAKSGGLSTIVSAIAVHNEIVRTRPDLAEELYRPMPWSWMGNEPKGAKPWYMQPIYSMRDGKFAGRYVRGHLRQAQKMPDTPKLTAKQIEALDTLDATTAREEFRLSMMFEPGDIQFVNNHITYHARTHFEDWPEPERKRHLLRLWLAMPNSRALDDGFLPFYRDVRPGALRGGFPSRMTERAFETFLID